MTRPDIDAIRRKLDDYPDREQLATSFRNFVEYPYQDADMYAAGISSRLVPPSDIHALLDFVEKLEQLEQLRTVEQNALADAVRQIGDLEAALSELKVKEND